MVNYIRDRNRFHLSAPPPWIQQQLFDFDPLLVIIPSRQLACFHLARRSKVTLSPDLLLCAENDTKMLAEHGLVPVTKIIRNGLSWNLDAILSGLRARDIWAHGGAEKVADAEDAADKLERQRILNSGRADMDHRARDAWRSYQARTGQRTRPTIAPSTSGRTPVRVDSPSTDRQVAR